AGFGELLLESPGASGGGYWSVPNDLPEIVGNAVKAAPQVKHFATDQEWIDWYCEGTAPTSVLAPPAIPPSVAIHVPDLTLSGLKAALATYEPELSFSDQLLASVVAALRAGDGKNFIILRGISGTGKSRLVSAVAKAVYAR